jgi:hypothetical protein
MTWLWSCPAGARHVEGEPMAWSRRVEEHRHKSPLLVGQDLALTRVETPRGWGVPCPHASRRYPP